MQRSSDRPEAHYRGTLVLEFLEGVTEAAYPVQIIASIHGREGTMSWSWGVPGRHLTPSQYLDLEQTVRRLLHDRFVTSVGLQAELGFG